MEILITRPQTVDEISQDNLKYKTLKEKKEEVIFSYTILLLQLEKMLSEPQAQYYGSYLGQ